MGLTLDELDILVETKQLIKYTLVDDDENDILTLYFPEGQILTISSRAFFGPTSELIIS